MNTLHKIGCAIIGWNPSILAQCGEASKRMYKKMLSAIFIMAVLWGTIGYVFADKYIGIEHWWGCAIVSFFFILIIVSIERIIILKVGQNKMIYTFRVVLALCMSFLGGFIFDQIIFSTDINSEIERRREQQEIPNTISLRQTTVQNEIDSYNEKIDSLGKVNERLIAEIGNKQVIKYALTTSRRVPDYVDSLGVQHYRTVTDIQEQATTNPKLTLVANNKSMIDDYTDKVSELGIKLRDIDNTVREEYKTKPVGFMEELDASWDIITQAPITLVVYGIFMLFILLLELMVVSTRMGEECDYDMIVEHQLHVKEIQLKNVQRNLTTDYVSNQMEKGAISDVNKVDVN